MSERILIVDDDASFRRIVEYTLKEEGYETAVAGDPIAALNKLDESSFSLVITDVRMPHMTGLELLEKLQAETPELPVIVVTAHAGAEDALRAMREGASDYIVKPINRDHLKVVVRKALDIQKLRSENMQLRQAVSGRLESEERGGRSAPTHRVFRLTSKLLAFFGRPRKREPHLQEVQK